MELLPALVSKEPLVKVEQEAAQIPQAALSPVAAVAAEVTSVVVAVELTPTR
jgi:hypothetical protein